MVPFDRSNMRQLNSPSSLEREEFGVSRIWPIRKKALKNRHEDEEGSQPQDMKLGIQRRGAGGTK